MIEGNKSPAVNFVVVIIQSYLLHIVHGKAGATQVGVEGIAALTCRALIKRPELSSNVFVTFVRINTFNNHNF
ncbi:hypothetical protein THOD03_60210 [Vibrio harveyi]|nr:hypothetical protein THOD03_60210 [Vibrio harveyi]